MNEQVSICRLEHPGIVALGVTLFRLTRGDSVAALVMNLDNSDVVVPLQAVARLFGLTPESADGQMIELIERALQFVPTLRPGDPLPTEVLTGEASWQPSSFNQQVATARLQLQLVNWIGGSTAGQDGNLTSKMLLASMEDPAVRPRMQEALRRAAAELGISGGGPVVAKLIEELAAELSFIEALRERLLERVHTMVKRLGRITAETAMSGSRRETLLQVSRLATAALGKIGGKFDEADAQTCEILPALRNLERQRGFLRPHRDWLYSTLIAWEPILLAWESLPGSAAGDRTWKVIEEAYRFLAPRYMAVQQWQTAVVGAERIEREKAAFIW